MTQPALGNVIISDDDRMIRSVLQAKFEALGVNVFLTADGLEAVELAGRIPALLIILDLKMPRLNGLVACERIRQMPCNSRTPIAILTSTHDKSAKIAGARAGATAFFTKPFRMPLLMLELARYLPISDALRDILRGDAERALAIAQAASSLPNPYGDRDHDKANGVLDRGKYVLGVLRG